jgi:hypothetical protein
MKVRAIRDSLADWPKTLPAWGSPKTPLHIINGTEYEVLAISSFEGLVFLMISPNNKFFSWIPVWFFETTDPRMPLDWICTATPYRDGVQMIIGPNFVANNEESYRRMVELESNEATAMWKRIFAESKPGEDA